MTLLRANLGAFISPWGICKPEVALETLLRRLKMSKLKPQQKLFVLRTHLLPKLTHTLVMHPMLVGLLDRLDRAVRKFLCGKSGILHLPASTPKAFYYAPVKDGGLGLMEFRTTIPALIVRRFDKMNDSPCLAVRAASGNTANMNRIRLAQKFIRRDELGNPVVDCVQIRSYHSEKLHRSFDGKPLMRASEVPSVHSWVADGKLMMTGQAFCESLNIRINALPTLARFLRGQTGRKECRAGCNAVESLQHVLQVCPRTHGPRIMRHDKVANCIVNNLKQRGYQVLEQPRIRTSEGLRKPDIIAIKNAEATVVDVLIGGSDDPNTAHRSKVTYYQGNQDITVFLRQEYEVERVHFGATVITPQGLLARKSAKTLEQLGLSKSVWKTLVVRALEHTTYIWHVFNKSTAMSWRRRRNKYSQ